MDRIRPHMLAGSTGTNESKALTAKLFAAQLRMLGLPFAGIDLRVSDTGRIVCFEVNPSPAFCVYSSWSPAYCGVRPHCEATFTTRTTSPA